MADDDVSRVACPAGCGFAGREHVHLEHVDGCGQVWGVADGRPTLLDPFDLQRTAVMLFPARQLRKPKTKRRRKRG